MNESEDAEGKMMWGTVVGVTDLGWRTIQFDDGPECTLSKLHCKLWGHKPDTLTVGTRIRCEVRVEWTPTYYVDAILNVVHQGGRK